MANVTHVVELFNDLGGDGWLVHLDGEPAEGGLMVSAHADVRGKQLAIQFFTADAVAAGVRAALADASHWKMVKTDCGWQWDCVQTVDQPVLSKVLDEVARQRRNGLLTQNNAAMKAVELLSVCGEVGAAAASFIAYVFTENDNLWLIRLTEHNGEKEYGHDVVVTARDEADAMRQARKRALHWYEGDTESEVLEDGQVEFEGGSIRVEIEYVQPIARDAIVQRAMN